MASTAVGFNGLDGILGYVPSNHALQLFSHDTFPRSIGRTDLTADTVAGEATVPTVTDNLFS